MSRCATPPCYRCLATETFGGNNQAIYTILSVYSPLAERLFCSTDAAGRRRLPGDQPRSDRSGAPLENLPDNPDSGHAALPARRNRRRRSPLSGEQFPANCAGCRRAMNTVNSTSQSCHGAAGGGNRVA